MASVVGVSSTVYYPILIVAIKSNFRQNGSNKIHEEVKMLKVVLLGLIGIANAASTSGEIICDVKPGCAIVTSAHSTRITKLGARGLNEETVVAFYNDKTKRAALCVVPKEIQSDAELSSCYKDILGGDDSIRKPVHVYIGFGPGTPLHIRAFLHTTFEGASPTLYTRIDDKFVIDAKTGEVTFKADDACFKTLGPITVDATKGILVKRKYDVEVTAITIPRPKNPAKVKKLQAKL